MELRFDVIVVGGGTAGLVAGIASGRQGVRTLMIERNGYLGGLVTTGMHISGMTDAGGRQVILGIPQELVERTIKLKGGRGHVFVKSSDRLISSMASVDPEIFKHVAFEMIEESKCNLWLYTSFVRGVRNDACGIDAIEVVNSAGVSRLTAEVFIDCTGGGDVAAAVGASFEHGKGIQQQAVTSIFRLANVDIAAAEHFMNEKINTEGKQRWTFEDSPMVRSIKYWTPWKIFPGFASRFPKLFITYCNGYPGDIVVNCTHAAINSLDPGEITRATIDLRRQAVEIVRFLREHIPGYQHAYLSHVYDLGVRESRRITGEYTLTSEDMASGRQFEDVICVGAHPPALHDARGGEILIHGSGWRSAKKEEDLSHKEGFASNLAYEIPYRSLLPKDLQNVIVAGRCLSAEFEAQSGARGMGPCGAMGQAAGTAAALAVKTGVIPKRLDVGLLQGTLLGDGAFLGDRFGVRPH